MLLQFCFLVDLQIQADLLKEYYEGLSILRNKILMVIIINFSYYICSSYQENWMLSKYNCIGVSIINFKWFIRLQIHLRWISLKDLLLSFESTWYIADRIANMKILPAKMLTMSPPALSIISLTPPMLPSASSMENTCLLYSVDRAFL